MKKKQNTKKPLNRWLLIIPIIALIPIIIFAILFMRRQQTMKAQIPADPVATVSRAEVSSTDTEKANEDALALEVSVEEARQLREDGAFVLDVREPFEWKEGHIPGATLIPLGELRQRSGEIPQENPIVVVCRSGNRSAQARDLLLRAGFKNVTSMAGGMSTWIDKGYELETGE